MGLFDFIRRKDERAIPVPGTPEFDAAVLGSALPDSRGVEMGAAGWSSVGDAGSVEELRQRAAAEQAAGGVEAQPASIGEVARAIAQAFGGKVEDQQGAPLTLDLRGVQGLREEVTEALREHGVDPESGQQVDAGAIPGLSEALTEVLGRHGASAGALADDGRSRRDGTVEEG